MALSTDETNITTELAKSPGATRDAAIAQDIQNDIRANYILPRNAGVTAAGTVLADAAQLSPGFTVVTGADGTVGVKLPATPVAGTLVIIKGVTSGVLKVWPDAAATINAVGSNGALSLTTGKMPSIFVADSTTQMVLDSVGR